MAVRQYAPGLHIRQGDARPFNQLQSAKIRSEMFRVQGNRHDAGKAPVAVIEPPRENEQPCFLGGVAWQQIA